MRLSVRGGYGYGLLGLINVRLLHCRFHSYVKISYSYQKYNRSMSSSWEEDQELAALENAADQCTDCSQSSDGSSVESESESELRADNLLDDLAAGKTLVLSFYLSNKVSFSFHVRDSRSSRHDGNRSPVH